MRFGAIQNEVILLLHVEHASIKEHQDCRSGQHGFYCFRQVVNGTYEIERRTPGTIGIPQLWTVLSDAGRRCAVIDAPMSVLDRDINGLQTVE